MKITVPLSIMALALWGSTIAGMDVEIGTREVEAALRIARDTDGARTAFHRRYTLPLNDATVERLEVITETRRLVQIAEAKIAGGDRLFGAGTRAVREALDQWRRKIAVVARLRFHPHNTYVMVPTVSVTLQAPTGDVARLDIRTDPVLALPSGTPGERLPVLGANTEAVFDATGLAQASRTAVVQLDGNELVRVPIDFSRFQ